MTAGNRPLISVIFLLAMFVIAHNAPMKSKREGGVSLVTKTQWFYCTSEMIKQQVQTMVK